MATSYMSRPKDRVLFSLGAMAQSPARDAVVQECINLARKLVEAAPNLRYLSCPLEGHLRALDHILKSEDEGAGNVVDPEWANMRPLDAAFRFLRTLESGQAKEKEITDALRDRHIKHWNAPTFVQHFRQALSSRTDKIERVDGGTGDKGDDTIRLRNRPRKIAPKPEGPKNESV